MQVESKHSFEGFQVATPPQGVKLNLSHLKYIPTFDYYQLNFDNFETAPCFLVLFYPSTGRKIIIKTKYNETNNEMNLTALHGKVQSVAGESPAKRGIGSTLTGTGRELAAVVQLRSRQAEAAGQGYLYHLAFPLGKISNRVPNVNLNKEY